MRKNLEKGVQGPHPQPPCENRNITTHLRGSREREKKQALLGRRDEPPMPETNDKGERKKKRGSAPQPKGKDGQRA